MPADAIPQTPEWTEMARRLFVERMSLTQLGVHTSSAVLMHEAEACIAAAHIYFIAEAGALRFEQEGPDDAR